MNVSEKDEIIQSMSMLIKNFENKMDTRLSKIEKRSISNTWNEKEHGKNAKRNRRNKT